MQGPIVLIWATQVLKKFFRPGSIMQWRGSLEVAGAGNAVKKEIWRVTVGDYFSVGEDGSMNVPTSSTSPEASIAENGLAKRSQ